MDIRVRAGQPIHLEIDYEGEPDPQATWTINGSTFNGTDRAELRTTDHRSQIDITSSVRSDTGAYGITVTNEYGADSAKCQVTVLDVPGIPVAPLKPSNIHKEGCTLTWKPPEVRFG